MALRLPGPAAGLASGTGRAGAGRRPSPRRSVAAAPRPAGRYYLLAPSRSRVRVLRRPRNDRAPGVGSGPARLRPLLGDLGGKMGRPGCERRRGRPAAGRSSPAKPVPPSPGGPGIRARPGCPFVIIRGPLAAGQDRPRAPPSPGPWPAQMAALCDSDNESDSGVIIPVFCEDSRSVVLQAESDWPFGCSSAASPLTHSSCQHRQLPKAPCLRLPVLAGSLSVAVI